MASQDPQQRRIGILVVGLGGANGVTLLAGLLANQKGLSWEGPSPWGRMSANLLGCITQLPEKGGSGGYKQRYGLADFCSAAVGGWDIRGTPLGQALYDARILDFDLVRQVQAEMDTLHVMPGVWDPDFIGETQHATATHVAPASLSAQARLDLLRGDIRKWVREQRVTGHTTVIWSASVERPSARNFKTAAELLSAVEADDPEVSPSMLYAAAAALEGCSFVNGGSQNTLCAALAELAARRGAYALGTDFKAGQTKFKTAAVEYIRTMGLTPKVIASSNHLGNNDMYNLTSKRTLDAKMRVKNDIFGPWEEHIDHQVRVMYTPLIGDEKRDIVEYTSWGFLNSTHTMLTYTRAMDSALCVPLMIDAAVWCDHFARRGVAPAAAAQATAYLFKVPEGGAKGVDPGFFRQMQRLREVLEEAALLTPAPAAAVPGGPGGAGGPRGAIVCAGLSCLDLQLCGSTQGASAETINTFQETRYCAGGSCPQVSSALACLGVHSIAITKVGADANGRELVRQMVAEGVDCSRVITDPDQQTALAVLPIYAATGGRGCFVNLAANNTLTAADILAQLTHGAAQPAAAAFHFGYPHFLPLIQGEALAGLLRDAKAALGGALVSMDLNGVDNDDAARNRHEAVLGAALPHADVLHANLEEAEAISGIKGDPAAAAQWFLARGVAVVAITMGADGAHVAATASAARAAAARLPAAWLGGALTLPAYALPAGAAANANGAGDTFVAGLVCAAVWDGDSGSGGGGGGGAPLTLEAAARLALLCAMERVSGGLRGRGGGACVAALGVRAVADAAAAATAAP